jgi:phosphoserine phosphatase RsbU/P
MRILVAEDDPVARRILHAALEPGGNEVLVAKNGEEAWKIMQHFAPNLVVSDFEMPERNGLSLCRAIRDLNAREYTYFILITGHTEQSIFHEAMAAGVDDFLSKPIDMMSLHSRLHVANRILEFHKQISTLKDLVPVCMYCKKVREDAGFWQKLETFIQHRIGADISHSVCPDCYQVHLQPQLDELKAEQMAAERGTSSDLP